MELERLRDIQRCVLQLDSETIKRHNDEGAKICRIQEQHMGCNGEKQNSIINSRIGKNSALYCCGECGYLYHAEKSSSTLKREQQSLDRRVTI